MTHIHIKNGRLIDPAQQLDAMQDIFIIDGKIAALDKPPANFKSELTIDAKQQIVCPGLIDMQVRMREPGQEHKATIASESLAAVKGGITSVCYPPDILPINDHPAITEFLLNRAQQTQKINLWPIAALTQQLKGEQLTEMAALKAAGCVGVSNANEPITDTRVWRRAFEYAATVDLPVLLRPEDYWLAKNGCVHEGIVATRLGLPAIPAAAEVNAVAQALILAEITGVRLHLSQLSTAAAVELLIQAQAKSLPVTADVAVHQLFLTEMDIDNFNSACHVRPPLRSLSDQYALREAVKNGSIQAICSDHEPQDSDAKLRPFAQTAPGISGLETLLSLCWRLTHKDFMTPMAVLSALTQGPAAILHLPVGTLSLHQQADICIFDPQQTWSVDINQWTSKGKNTPFLNWEMFGKVTWTLKSGNVVYHQGK